MPARLRAPPGAIFDALQPRRERRAVCETTDVAPVAKLVDARDLRKLSTRARKPRRESRQNQRTPCANEATLSEALLRERAET